MSNAKADKILAEVFDRTGNLVSGLVLDDIGEDGHAVANLMWKISSYLKRRAQTREDFGDDGMDEDAPQQEV